MGVYLHSKKPFLLFQETASSTYFVDKSQIIKDLIPLIDHTLPVTDGILKERGYALRFQGKLGEQPRYTGRILAVGIAYYKKDKKHTCKIELLRGANTAREVRK